MSAGNVYLRRDAVESFVKSIRYDEAALKRIARRLEQHFVGRGDHTLRILDVGIGDGAFTVPMLAYLTESASIGYQLDCLDASEHMISALQTNLQAHGIPQPKVQAYKADANLGLRPSYPAAAYDLAVITFVLQYIERWEELLADLTECLRDGGLFIQAEIAGALRYVDGYFDADGPPAFADFWRHYFDLRNTLSEWCPAISVSDLSVVYAHLAAQGHFRGLWQETYVWPLNFAWRDLCSWIAAGPLSSLGSGLDDHQRLELASAMEGWLSTHNVSADEQVTLEWGFKVTCLQKTRPATDCGSAGKDS